MTPADTDILSPLIGLTITILGWWGIRMTLSRPLPSRPQRRGRILVASEGPPTTASPSPSPVASARRLVAVAQNTADHPYDEMPLSDLQSHLFDAHFEVWNLVGERNPSPGKWRGEHAADHGLEIVGSKVY